MKPYARRELRILDFDTECRPMHYSEWRAESQITGIAWSWADSDEDDGEDDFQVEVLLPSLKNERSMLRRFLTAFNEADIVTGHYIRKHDLPLLVDHCARLGLPLPKQVLTSDTKIDLVDVRGLGASQENLSVTFGLSAEKHRMSGADWRIANNLNAEGRNGTRTRVVADVLQHKELRATLIERGLLKPPRMWRP